MMKKIFHYFDKLEDRIRNRLSRYPIIYSIIGGTAIVLFWRGVWITADQVARTIPESFIWIDGPLSVIVSLFILLATGLFVSFFVSDQIILSGMKKDKKIVEKTESEVRAETTIVEKIQHEMVDIEHEIKEIHNSVVTNQRKL